MPELDFIDKRILIFPEKIVASLGGHPEIKMNKQR
jgi:hypothetical protein